MRQRGKGTAPLKANSASSGSGEAGKQENNGGVGGNSSNDNNVVLSAKRSSYVIFTLFVLVIYGAWGVYHYQFESLPPPLALENVGKRGFSEHEAMKHVQALTQLGPHPVGSDALENAVKVVSWDLSYGFFEYFWWNFLGFVVVENCVLLTSNQVADGFDLLEFVSSVLKMGGGYCFCE